MKNQLITFQTLCNAVKHQYKIWLLTILVFTVIGAGAGFLYASRGSSSQAGGAQPLEGVAISQVPYNEEYYFTMLNAIEEYAADCSRYLNQLLEEGSLTEEQIKSLKGYSEALVDYQKMQIIPLKEMLASSARIFVPDEFQSVLIEKYEDKLINARWWFESTKLAAELAKSIEAPRVDNESAMKSYADILDQASQHSLWEVEIQSLETKLNLLKNDAAQVHADGAIAENTLDAAVQSLQSIVNGINHTVNDIAEKNHLEITMDQSSEGLITSIRHTHAASSTRESFFIMVIFCLLVGICCGFFLAVYRECRAQSACDRE